MGLTKPSTETEQDHVAESTHSGRTPNSWICDRYADRSGPYVAGDS